MKRVTPLLSMMWMLGCGSGPAMPSQTPAALYLTVDERVAYPLPADEAPEAVRALHASLQRVIGAEMEAPAGLSIAAYQRWANAELAPFIAAHRDRLEELEAQARAVAASGEPADRAFAAIAIGHAWERFHRFFGELSPPTEIAANSELASAFQAALQRPAAAIAHRAADAYRACADAGVPSVVDWRAECATRSRALASVEAPPEPPAPGPETVWPSECGAATHFPLAPEAPAPDRSQPEAFALRIVHWEGGAPDRRVLEALRGAVAEHLDGSLLPQSSVDAALRLQSEHRLRAGGARCGQPPPLGWILSERHPNLVFANVSAQCISQGPGAGCRLRVSFERPGAPSATDVPANLSAEAAEASNEAWMTASGRLEPQPTAAILGHLVGGSGGEALRIDGADDEDPWLRVGQVLSQQREALAACASREGGAASAFDVRFGVSPTGQPSEVRVDAGPNGTDEQASCVRETLEQLAWPCTPSGEARQVEVQLCLAPSPER